jgi:hypothetical protein
VKRRPGNEIERLDAGVGIGTMFVLAGVAAYAMQPPATKRALLRAGARMLRELLDDVGKTAAAAPADLSRKYPGAIDVG